MTVLRALPPRDNWDALILATDIDTNMIATGRAGLYDAEKVAPVPPEARRRFVEPVDADTVEMAPALKRIIRFKPLNLLDPWPMRGKFDVIFCRNVVIYFDKDTQRALFNRYADLLKPEGWLFIGHSESLFRVSDRFPPPGPNHLSEGAMSCSSARGQPFHPASAAQTVRMTRIRINPGGHYVTSGNEMLVTVLGSCVAACIRDPLARVGGMNHFMLPQSDSGAWGIASATMRFGNFAMEQLINEILCRGGRRHNLEIKVFGGAGIIGSSAQVGLRNADFVETYLQEEGLPIAAQIFAACTRGAFIISRSPAGSACWKCHAPSARSTKSNGATWTGFEPSRSPARLNCSIEEGTDNASQSSRRR